LQRKLQAADLPPTIPKDRGRKLRKAMTPAELKLWWRLRNRGVEIKFRRQHPIGPYVVDFCSIEAMLIVEIDGGQHDQEENRRADSRRTQYLEEQGYRVLRLWNNDVLNNCESAIAYIVDFLNGPSPGAARRPLPSRGRGHKQIAHD
jgi:very-short-patch-repair endonuclease